jgi:hypothetical protein
MTVCIIMHNNIIHDEHAIMFPMLMSAWEEDPTQEKRQRRDPKVSQGATGRLKTGKEWLIAG